MNRIAILGSSLEALQRGHMCLDENVSAKIMIYTEDAEPGFPDIGLFEEIELEKSLRSIPGGWLASIPNVVGRNKHLRLHTHGYARLWLFAWQRGAHNFNSGHQSWVLMTNTRKSRSEEVVEFPLGWIVTMSCMITDRGSRP